MLCKNVTYRQFLPDNSVVNDIPSDAIVDDLIWDETYALNIPENCVGVDLDFGHLQNNDAEAKIKFVLERLSNLKYYALKTDHGMHLYFRNNSLKVLNTVKKSLTNYATTCGLFPVDYKLKGTCLTVVKNGTIREWVVAPDNMIFDATTLDLIPVWLLPYVNHKTDTTDLWQMSVGSREASLFTWCLGMHKVINCESVPVLLNFINTQIFKTPLEKNIIETKIKQVTDRYANSDSVDTARFIPGARNKSWSTNVAEYIMTEFNVQLYNSQPWGYNQELRVYQSLTNKGSGVYIQIKLKLLSIYRGYTLRDIEEAIGKIFTLIHNDKFKNITSRSWNSQFISVKNGILDNKGNLQPHTPDIFTNVYINCSWNPLAYDKRVDDCLNEWLVEQGDKQQRAVFEELVLGGVIWDRQDIMRRGAFLLGPRETCKTCMLTGIKRFLGEWNCGNSTFSSLDGKDPAALIALSSKIINIDVDINSETRFSQDVISYQMRLIGSGDGLTLRDLYSSSATYEFKLKFIAACNKPPRLETAQDAYFNRWLIFWCGKQKPDFWKVDEEIIIEYITDHETAREYLLLLAVEGWARYQKQGKFTESAIMNKKHDDWIKSTITVYQWVEDELITVEYIVGKTSKTLYAAYKNYCPRLAIRETKFREYLLMKFPVLEEKGANHIFKKKDI